MMQLTPTALQFVDNLAQRYGVSRDAVLHMLDAVQRGGGTMAQFHHPELGGGGQWMQGGMTMVGDMFNYQLKASVDGLCQELSGLLSNQPFMPAPQSTSFGGSMGGVSGNWWPAELGSPASSGGQNNIRYAYFPDTRRLAVETDGVLRLYDTGEHYIQGVSQQQGGFTGLSFSSQFGTISVADLPEIGGAPPMSTYSPPEPMLEPEAMFEPAPMPAPMPEPAPMAAPAPSNPAGGESQATILATLEKLGELHERGILSEAEFSAKKAELLARL